MAKTETAPPHPDMLPYVYAHADGAPRPGHALCLFKGRAFAVLAMYVPEPVPVGPQRPPMKLVDPPMSVTHLATGMKACSVGDLWRGKMTVEALDAVFGDEDVLADRDQSVERFARAVAMVEEREAAIVRAMTREARRLYDEIEALDGQTPGDEDDVEDDATVYETPRETVERLRGMS